MSDLKQDIYTYLRYPVLRVPEKPEKPWRTMAGLLLITLVAATLASLFNYTLIASGLIPGPGTTPAGEPESRWLLLAGALFLGPLMEEITFRMQLRYLWTNLIFLAFICGALLSTWTGTQWAYLVSPPVFVLLYVLYRFNLAGSISRKHQFRKKYFPFYFHFTAISFAYFHWGNFSSEAALLPFGLIYTLPQLACGLLFGYVRMRYGLLYSIVLHCCYNLLPALLLFSR